MYIRMPLSKPQKEPWTILAYFRSSRKDVWLMRQAEVRLSFFFFYLLTQSTLLCTPSAIRHVAVTRYRKFSNKTWYRFQWHDLLPHSWNTLTYLFTYLLTPWCSVLLEKLTGLQLVKKFPAFHGTWRFITALTNVRQLSLSWASPVQSIYPHPTSWRSILILSTHLRLGLPSGLLPSGFPSMTLYTPLSSPIRATCSAHLILLDFITRTILGEEYKSFSSKHKHTNTNTEETWWYHRLSCLRN